jgi:hypothetical protein
MLYVQRTTKMITLLSMPMCFSLEDNDCFFCFFTNDTNVDDLEKKSSRLSHQLLFVFVHLFLFKIYLYNSLYYFIDGHIDKRFLYF